MIKAYSINIYNIAFLLFSQCYLFFSIQIDQVTYSIHDVMFYVWGVAHGPMVAFQRHSLSREQQGQQHFFVERAVP